MINLLEGVPGSGKSYESVVYHVLPALKAGRKVITNLPLKLSAFDVLFPELVHLIEIRKTTMPIYGRWDAEAAGRGEQAFVLGEFDHAPVMDEGGQIRVAEREVFTDHTGTKYLPAPAVPLFQSVWDFYSEWRGKDGIGPLYVIDECHVSFPKPKRNKPKGTPDEVIEWFKLSRHFGADVLLMTQRMGALEEDIAGLAEFHIRVRKAAFLGKDDHYIRRVFAGFRGGEISNDEREYQSQYFPLYKSHTQGQTVIENRSADVTPSHLKWQRRGYACMLVGFAGIAWIVGGLFFKDDKPAPKPTSNVQVIPMGTAPAVPAPARPVLPAAAPAPVLPPAPVMETVVVKPPEPVIPDPLETRLVHMTGCFVRHEKSQTICTFTVSQNGMAVFSVTSVELQEIGYEFSRLGDCAAVLTWKATGSLRTVICDSPSVGLSVAKIS